MQRLCKLSFLVVFILLAEARGFSQNAVNSPYSRFGLGDLHQDGFVRNMSMGGISLGMRETRFIDYANPASFSARDSLSFLFDFGMQAKTNQLKTGNLEAVSTDFNFRHMAMAFPITRWMGTSMGVVPYSTMSYSILEQGELDNIGAVNYSYNGSGGLSRFYLGTGARIGKYLSAGISMNYLFGNLERTTRVQFPEDPDAAETLMQYRLEAGDIYFTYGTQLMVPIRKDYFVRMGVVFENETKISSSVNRFNQYILSPGSTASFDTLVDETTRRNLLLPTQMGVGFSFGKTNRLVAGAEYRQQNWSVNVLPGVTDSLTSSHSFRAGFEYLPNHLAMNNYLATIRYRAGAYYNQSYLRIRGEQINDFGITFGLGLPLPRTNTTFNLAFQLGQRGSLNNNLIRETYGTIGFSLTLYDFWFIKYKFD